MLAPRRKARWSAAGAAAAALLLTGLGAAPAAAADTSTPITADLLPTWQTNGRVWALESVNGVVYAAGDFTAVRPSGAAPGKSEVARTNFAAFRADTGALLPCAPTFTIGTGSVTVRALEASPDGTRLYVGGSFGKINGTGLANLASLDVSTCQLTSASTFRRPTVNGRVYGLHAVGNAVYAVGEFTKVDDLARPKFASFSTGGVLSGLTANFSATTRAVLAAPDAGRVYVGGSFSTVNGESSRGIVALNLSDGKVAQRFSWLPSTSATKALVRSGNTFFLGAEGTGTNVFDGRLAADVATGKLLWKDTCLGATQALAVKDGLLYSASHSHDCANTPGGFEEAGFRQHLLAQNISDKTIRHWFPDTNEGIEMDLGEALGPRALVFAGDDLWVGGEFTAVNDFSKNATPQWGLARFAGSPDTGTNYAPALSVSSTARGKVNVRWTTAYDRDDETLKYELYRDGRLVNTQTSVSKEWNRPVLSFTDTVTPGARVSYRMRVVEADGGNTGPLGGATSVVVSNPSHLSLTASAGRSGTRLRSVYVTTSVATSQPTVAKGSKVYVQQLKKGVWRTVGSRVLAAPNSKAVTVRWTSSKAATLRVTIPKLGLVSPKMTVPAAPKSGKSRYYVRDYRSGQGEVILRVFKDGTTYAVNHGAATTCSVGRLASNRLTLKSVGSGSTTTYRTTGTWKKLTIVDPLTLPVGGARTALTGTNKRYLGSCAAPAYARVTIKAKG